MRARFVSGVAALVFVTAASGADVRHDHAGSAERCLSSAGRSQELQANDAAQLKAMHAAPQLAVPNKVQDTLARLLSVAQLPAGGTVKVRAVKSAGTAWVSGSGVIFLSTSLWTGERPLEPDEMAAVLAHELAHLEEGDTKHRLCDAVAASRVDDVPFSVATSVVKQVIWGGDQELAILMMRRNHLRELRADRRGAEMLTAIGLGAEAMSRMLVKVTPPGEGDYSASHPAIEVRLENLVAFMK